ncbi:MAG: GHKL domain-containing protein, partial [Synergistaceae bacterium]|nr:GHKL domain-containing protein [Synergistaceae bacterium]
MSMTHELALRYAVELSLFIPAVMFAVIPVAGYLRVRQSVALCSSALIMAVMILAGSYFGVHNRIRVRIIAVPLAAAVFMLYMLTVDAEAGKKLFCFSNALMICVICPMYTITLNAPSELGNAYGVFTFSSGIISLSVSILLGAIFFRTLTVKIPTLLKEDSIRDIWRCMFLVPLGMSGLIYWMTPVSPAVVMTGRVRPVQLALVTLVAGGIFLLLHVFWWAVSRLTERAELQQENTLLSMESKRYTELRKYMDETREMRHDFRQHVFVIASLADGGKIPELRAYVSQLAENSVKSYRSFCANGAVDAVASHYDRLAESQGASVSWRLELPHELPITEPEYCAMLGNLLENALEAVRVLPAESRQVKVISSMLSDAMLGLSVDNNFAGNITLGRNGLPVPAREGHGLGLLSVMNTVNHYGGNMDIN